MVGSEKGAVVSGSATVADLTCASSTTLESLAACIRDQMPQTGSDGFVECDSMARDGSEYLSEYRGLSIARDGPHATCDR